MFLWAVPALASLQLPCSPPLFPPLSLKNVVGRSTARCICSGTCSQAFSGGHVHRHLRGGFWTSPCENMVMGPAAGLGLSRQQGRQPEQPHNTILHWWSMHRGRGVCTARQTHPFPCYFLSVLSSGAMMAASNAETTAAAEQASDPDIVEELQALRLGAPPSPASSARPPPLRVALRIVNNAHAPTEGSVWLLEEVGAAQVHAMTHAFYKKAFADPHLTRFFRDKTDPHAERLANWIVEKMGGGSPWTSERRTRPQKVVALAGGHKHVVHDRSSAHVAAWYAPAREPEKVGQHFQLDDSRVWMRLMFWAAREAGLLRHPHFADWYVRFIGHFVRVYERKAPAFARESMRWSEEAARPAAYEAAGRRMPDVVGVTPTEALKQLPPEERHDGAWPYEL